MASDLGMLTADLAGVFRSAFESAGLEFDVQVLPLPRATYVDRDMWEKVRRPRRARGGQR
jgi:hypothetical protein